MLRANATLKVFALFRKLLISCPVAVIELFLLCPAQHVGATNTVSTHLAPAISDEVGESRVPSPADVDRAIELAKGYLIRSCGPDGKFVYKVDIGSGKESASYDIIRHAGAIYALAMLNQYRPDPDVAQTMIRAAGYLRKNYLGPGVREGQLTVWMKPVSENSDSHKNYAELGGTGLGIVALAAVRQVDPKSVSLDELQSMGRFLLFLQKEDGSFVHKYQEASGPVANWISLYYPGEAALGFISLYEADHSTKWLKAAGNALDYLARKRIEQSVLPADHWALVATARLLSYSDQIGSTISRQELVQHAMRLCASIASEQFHGSAPTALDGAFDVNGRTAPAATRLEGLLSALEFLPEGELRNKVKVASDCGINFLLRAQMTSGPETGGMPGAIISRARESRAIRIDYVQHAICAWLRYQRVGFSAK